MNLDVDLGNTRIKWRIGKSGAVQAAPVKTWPDVITHLPDSIRQVRVCSVVGTDIDQSFAAACQARWKVTPQYAKVVARHRCLRIIYDDPATLGVDRWLAMLASSERFPRQDLIVVSGGTAVTVDLVGSNGAHAGGFILPGLGAASRALFAAAPRLPLEPVRVLPEWLPGTTTETCINAGFSALYQGLFLAILQRQPQSFSAAAAVFTGGDGRALMRLCPASVNAFFQAELVLDGLDAALQY